MLYHPVLLTHSLMRLALLGLLTAVVVCALLGWQNKKTFSCFDNALGLVLLIAAHLQLLLGATLYLFLSPNVRFAISSMGDSNLRYWLVEHITMMITAIVLITVGRIRSNKAPNDILRFRRLFVWNISALALVIVAIFLSGRAFFSLAG